MPSELKNNVDQARQENEAPPPEGRAKPGRDKSGPYASWRRRPLAGLRWQLTFVHSLLLSILLILFGLWVSFSVEHMLSFSTQVVALILIVVGAISLFVLTNFLLRPLRRITDAAQAITLGDWQQRERLVPLLEGDDEVSRLAASLNVIVDQLERASQSQQASEQRFRRLFSDASHQLRTPLTSLRGFSEVLMRRAKDDPETTQRVLKLMNNEAERMTLLVNDLLMLARLDDSQELEIRYIDLIDIAVEGVEQAKLLATDGRKVTLSFFLTEERLGIHANKDRLKQVLQILFDNALKYGRPAPDGWIRLQLDRQDDHALIHVIDNGKGIHQDDLPHIFDRFYRGQHMPRYDPPWKVPQGTGLGLSIAMAIVHAHQGEITVLSTPDRETIFTVKLPCVISK
ncbi:MAG TPA: HAMP domain-containing sensor histidine kinase [Ktedonobacteraceae bacterium]|nr:HAMP domain-containing sensor histidine kinase [Ktedonobacteraceae bacterium]